MNYFLLNIMLEEQNNENKPNQIFSSHSFTNMSKKCYEEFNYAIKKSYIKNHIKTLKVSFHACLDLFKNLSRFTMNPITFNFFRLKLKT